MTNQDALGKIRLARLETIEMLRNILDQVDGSIVNIGKTIDTMQARALIVQDVWIAREQLGENTSTEVAELNDINLRISLQEKILIEAHQRRERYKRRHKELRKILDDEEN